MAVDTLELKLANFVTLTATGFMLDTGATGTPETLQFLPVGAKVKIGSLVLGGEARNFAFLGDGTFGTKPGFGVFLGVGSATGDSFKWPSLAAGQINAIGITGPTSRTDPERLRPDPVGQRHRIAGHRRAEVLRLDRGRQDRRRQLLAEGKFPIIDIDSIGVTVRATCSAARSTRR